MKLKAQALKTYTLKKILVKLSLYTVVPYTSLHALQVLGTAGKLQLAGGHIVLCTVKNLTTTINVHAVNFDALPFLNENCIAD
jgi:hypothetical protein